MRRGKFHRLLVVWGSYPTVPAGAVCTEHRPQPPAGIAGTGAVGVQGHFLHAFNSSLAPRRPGRPLSPLFENHAPPAPAPPDGGAPGRAHRILQRPGCCPVASTISAAPFRVWAAIRTAWSGQPISTPRPPKPR